MSWTGVKDTNLVGLVKELIRLQNALLSLKAHQQLARLNSQVRMVVADNTRAKKEQKP